MLFAQDWWTVPNITSNVFLIQFNDSIKQNALSLIASIAVRLSAFFYRFRFFCFVLRASLFTAFVFLFFLSLVLPPMSIQATTALVVTCRARQATRQ